MLEIDNNLGKSNLEVVQFQFISLKNFFLSFISVFFCLKLHSLFKPAKGSILPFCTQWATLFFFLVHSRTATLLEAEDRVLQIFISGRSTMLAFVPPRR